MYSKTGLYTVLDDWVEEKKVEIKVDKQSTEDMDTTASSIEVSDPSDEDGVDDQSIEIKAKYSINKGQINDDEVAYQSIEGAVVGNNQSEVDNQSHDDQCVTVIPNKVKDQNIIKKKSSKWTDNSKSRVLMTKSQGKKHSSKENIALKNRFSVLEEEPCMFNRNRMFMIGKHSIFHVEKAINKMFMIGKQSIFHVKKAKSSSEKIVQKQDEMNESKIKCERDYLKKFETDKPFDILRGNEESDVSDILKLNEIMNKSKPSLKKCKKCNYKKRVCSLNPNKCKASQCFCSQCKKFGHFPQSLNCKASVKSLKSKKKPDQVQDHQPNISNQCFAGNKENSSH